MKQIMQQSNNSTRRRGNRKPADGNRTSTQKPQSRNRNAAPNSRAKKKSKLNPELFVQKAIAPKAEDKIETRAFSELNLNKQLAKNIVEMGFENTTPIQDSTFERLVKGMNLIGIANTGTGKTGAFLIPLLQRLGQHPDERFQTLIVVPTRELALQVYDEFKKLGKGMNLSAACFIGGTNVDKDVRSAKNRFDFVIGTPGRLLDLATRGSLKLQFQDVLILDEFDKMLDMGFIHDIRNIVGKMRSRKQTLLFSATKDKKQQAIIDEIVENPFIVEIHSGDKSSNNVDQNVIHVKEGQDKFQLLLDVLNEPTFDKVILFTETKHLANRVAKKLNDAGIKSDQIHGNKSQNYRINALDKFKKGAIRILVATDIAARGIDVEDVSLVINYQAPIDFDTYIHRVGRTGRAGKTGKAYTFVD